MRIEFDEFVFMDIGDGVLRVGDANGFVGYIQKRGPSWYRWYAPDWIAVGIVSQDEAARVCRQVLVEAPRR